MMSFCKSVHTLLGFPNTDDRRNPHLRCRNSIAPPYGLGLCVLAGEIPKPRNVVESSAVGPAAKPHDWVDPGARGLHDSDGGEGIGLCTESLGFESLDGRGGAEGDEEEDVDRREWWMMIPRRKEGVDEEEEEKFPPPLPWLAGRRRCFMRAVRAEGRILMTEVTIERREVLRASRADGRLRLHFVRAEPEEEEEEEEEKVDAEAEEVEDRQAVSCQKAVSGHKIPQWWDHHRQLVTTV